MTYPLHFLHIAMFGKSSMDDVTSIMSQNCGGEEKKTKRQTLIYIFSNWILTNNNIFKFLSLSSKMTIWQDRHNICSSDRTHRIILRHYLCLKTFHECLTKMAALRGPRESSCVIVGTYLPFFCSVFSGLSPPWILPSWLFLTHLIFTGTFKVQKAQQLPKHAVLGLLDCGSSSFPDSSFLKQEKNVESVCVR